MTNESNTSLPPSPHAPDERVDLGGLDLVQVLHCLLDDRLVGAAIHDEDDRVVVLDHLERRLGGERVLHDRELVERRRVRHSVLLDLGDARRGERLGQEEARLGADLANAMGASDLEGLLGLATTASA